MSLKKVEAECKDTIQREEEVDRKEKRWRICMGKMLTEKREIFTRREWKGKEREEEGEEMH